MARLNVEAEAFTDIRFRRLGRLLSVDRFSALGRMEAVWLHCLTRQTHFVTRDELEDLMELDAWDAVAAAELGDVDQETGRMRIRGLEGRIEWLEVKREASKKGAEARRRQAASLRAQTQVMTHQGHHLVTHQGTHQGHRKGSRVDTLMETPPAPAPAPAPAPKDLVPGHIAPSVDPLRARDEAVGVGVDVGTGQTPTSMPWGLGGDNAPARRAVVSAFAVAYCERTGSKLVEDQSLEDDARKILRKADGDIEEARRRIRRLFSADAPAYLRRHVPDLGTVHRKWAELAGDRWTEEQRGTQARASPRPRFGMTEAIEAINAMPDDEPLPVLGWKGEP